MAQELVLNELEQTLFQTIEAKSDQIEKAFKEANISKYVKDFKEDLIQLVISSLKHSYIEYGFVHNQQQINDKVEREMKQLLLHCQDLRFYRCERCAKDEECYHTCGATVRLSLDFPIVLENKE